MKQLIIYGLAIIGFIYACSFLKDAIVMGFITYACMTRGGC